MSWYEPEDPIECPACRGEDEECNTCEGTGYVTPSERREYIADARAEQDRE